MADTSDQTATNGASEAARERTRRRQAAETEPAPDASQQPLEPVDNDVEYTADDMQAYALQRYGAAHLAAGAFLAGSVTKVKGLKAAKQLVDDFSTQEV